MHLDPFYPQTMREEELKNKVAADWFGPFDCTRIIGKVDFCVEIPATYNRLLANLRTAMKALAANIEPKVYEYGFLLR